MSALKIKAAFFITISIFSSSVASADILDELRERQKDVKTLKANFAQEKKTALLDRPIKSKGVFYFKSPLGVRWEYEEGLLLLYDGKYLYMYHPEMDAAEKIKGITGYQGPLNFDIGFLMDEYDIKASKEGDKIRLSLKPKKEMPFKSMELLFPPGGAFPMEVKVVEETGDYSVIRFDKIQSNVKLNDSLFRFTPPPGVQIRERELME